MKNNLALTCIVGFIFFSSIISAEKANFTVDIATRFAKLWHSAPQEKIYLHTDKPYFYSAGDDLWFNAYIVNAATHKLDTKSQFVYVELIDQSNSVLTRVKIKRDLIGADGKIHLPADIAPGEYVLRAYTYWMQNISEDFFFHKKIFIGNMIDDRVQMSYKLTPSNNDQISMVITFVNTFSKPLTEKKIAVAQYDKKKRKKTTYYFTNQQGEIHLLVENSAGQEFIEVLYSEPGIAFNRKIQIPNKASDFDVQFFPESGVFLDNNLQTIGFKAIGPDGLSVNITGKIYNQREEELGEFSSKNKGMGKFILSTNPGDHYHTVITDEAGNMKRFFLPETTSQGVSISLQPIKDKIYYRFAKQNIPDTNQLFLMIHARGVIYYITPLDKNTGFLAEGLLPTGICSFSIIDSLENVWCERLAFIRSDHFPTIQMESDKNVYTKREHVDLKFKLTSHEKQPIRGNFSVSITDSHLVAKDSINNDIISYLLLSSDLKGYIEEPQQYFYDNSLLTREKTDLLMLTQGWKRFNTKDIIKRQYPKYDYYLEMGQSVSGKVLNLFNKPAKNSNIIFFSNYKNQITTTKTDSIGQFIMEGIEFPDSTQIILKAKSRSRIADVELIIDKDIFPPTKLNIPFSQEGEIDSPEDFLQLSKEKYYNEGGMLVINLDEVVIKGTSRKEENESYYSGMADNSINAEKLESYGNMTVLDIINTFPGVFVTDESVSIRGSHGNPLFLIDGIETEEIDDLRYLSASDLEEISLFKGASTSIFGLRGGSGVISITLKKGAALAAVTPPSLIHFSPLGYQKPVEFYVPKYEVDSILYQKKPDLRTTIYWAPKLQTDEDGCIYMQFYTADKTNDYRVELEGITKDGEVCKYEGIIQMKD